jgi:glycosyltransferase involved in cell wall biosynthesis
VKIEITGGGNVKILILFSQPWKTGGAETHVQALIQGLYKDHTIFLAINKGSDRERVRELCNQFPRLRLYDIQARGCNILRWVRDIYKLAKIIKQYNIDIVSAQQRTAGVWASILKKMTGKSFVVTMHDSWHRAIAKKCYSRLFNRVICVSNNLIERLCGDFGFSIEQLVMVNNGIDFEKFVPQEKAIARKKLGLTDDELLILHVSRLSSIKGAVALVLLEAFPCFIEKYPHGKITIIGEGPLRSKIEEKARILNERYGDVVSVLNFTNTIIDWYSSADLIVGEGRVAIEALACLKPVVAIRNEKYFFGNVSENNIEAAMKVNFDGNVFIVEPDTLTREMEQSLTLPLKARQQILQSIKGKMSIEVMAQQYIGVFKNSLEQGK